MEAELHRRQQEAGQTVVGNYEDARHLLRDAQKFAAHAGLPVELQARGEELTRETEQLETQVASYLMGVAERLTGEA